MTFSTAELATIVVAALGLGGGAVKAWTDWRIGKRDLVHREAEAIWEDAAELRTEIKRERDELRTEVAGLNAKIDALSVQVAKLTRLACASAPWCELRKEIGENG